MQGVLDPCHQNVRLFPRTVQTYLRQRTVEDGFSHRRLDEIGTARPGKYREQRVVLVRKSFLAYSG